jgi:hypothetical protein
MVLVTLIAKCGEDLLLNDVYLPLVTASHADGAPLLLDTH